MTQTWRAVHDPVNGYDRVDGGRRLSLFPRCRRYPWITRIRKAALQGWVSIDSEDFVLWQRAETLENIYERYLAQQKIVNGNFVMKMRRVKHMSGIIGVLRLTHSYG